MVITLSERRLSGLIRQLENITDSDEEICFRMALYAERLFRHIAEFGIRMQGMIDHQGGIANFQFTIAGVGKNWTGDFDWDKLRSGLNAMNPLAITVEPEDIDTICSSVIRVAMLDNWHLYASSLERITVGELQNAIENACLKFAWNAPIQMGGDESNTDATRELAVQDVFGRAGIIDPSLRSKAIEAYNRKEIEAVEAARNAREKEYYERFSR